MARYMAFGYEISDGQIQVIEREAEVVRNVYSLYVQGLSLKSISERLNQIPITYAGDGRAWDKNMVKRMLENPKYIGDKGFPVIIPQETADLALKIKSERHANISDEDKSRIDAYRKLAECSVCGSRMKRNHAGSGKKRKIYWHCTNKECEGNHHMFKENILDKLMTDVINELAGNLELIEYTVQLEYEKDTDIIRATNEMNETMDNLEIDTEDVIAKIMDLASLKFSKCRVGSNTAITDNMSHSRKNRQKKRGKNGMNHSFS